jgi:hypothetical protein
MIHTFDFIELIVLEKNSLRLPDDNHRECNRFSRKIFGTIENDHLVFKYRLKSTLTFHIPSDPDARGYSYLPTNLKSCNMLLKFQSLFADSFRQVS